MTLDPKFLVDCDWLAEHLDDANVRILDVTAMLTSKLENLAHDKVFTAGHIPGALFFDVASGKGVLSNPDASLPWTWPSVEQVEAAMLQVGVSNSTQVVIYAGSPRPDVDRGMMWCTRTWWVLHHFGAKCAILNGGFEAWKAAGHKIETGPAKTPPRIQAFEATSDGRKAVATKDDVLEALASGKTCVVDALPEASYDGTSPGASYARPGHITGAISAPSPELLSDDRAAFLDATVLEQRLAAKGLTAESDVISYCGGGIAATIDAFALKMLGNGKVRVYDNSLFEWAADLTLPMTDPSVSG